MKVMMKIKMFKCQKTMIPVIKKATGKFLTFFSSADSYDEQKEPSEVLYKKRCSLKFRKTHRKTFVPESVFQKRFLRLFFKSLFTEHLWATASGWMIILQTMKMNVLFRSSHWEAFLEIDAPKIKKRIVEKIDVKELISSGLLLKLHTWVT